MNRNGGHCGHRNEAVRRWVPLPALLTNFSRTMHGCAARSTARPLSRPPIPARWKEIGW